MPPFIVYALPRSRTAWLAKFLTCESWKCHHDIVTDLFTISDIVKKLQEPKTGTVETGMIEGFNVVRKIFPNARTVIIRRPVHEVINSLARLGLYGPVIEEDIHNRARLLDLASENPDVLTIPYEELEYQSSCRAIFEFCIGKPMSDTWWWLMENQNIQIDMTERVQKLIRNRDNIQALKTEVAEYEGRV